MAKGRAVDSCVKTGVKTVWNRFPNQKVDFLAFDGDCLIEGLKGKSPFTRGSFKRD